MLFKKSEEYKPPILNRQKILFIILAIIFLVVILKIYDGVSSLTSMYYVPKVNVITILLTVYSNSFFTGIALTALSLALAYLVTNVLLKRRRYDPRGYKLGESKASGASHMLTPKEKREIFQMSSIKNPQGVILGIDKDTGEVISNPWKHTNPNKARANDNIVLFGTSGSRKTSSIIIPYMYQLLERGDSIAAFDPKGELYRETIALATKNEYSIRILNLLGTEFKYSDGWDMLKLIRDADEDDANTIADLMATIIVENTGINTSGDSFWVSANFNCLKLALLYVAKSEGFKTECTKNSQTTFYPNSTGNYRVFDSVARLISSSEMKSLINTSLTSEYDKELLSSSYNTWSSHSQADSIQAGLATRLSIFNNKSLAKILSEDEIDIKELTRKDKKTIFYIICSDKDSVYKSVLTIFSAFLFKITTDEADKRVRDEDKKPIALIFEEMNNIGKIPDLSKKVSTLRSRKIRMLFCYQNIGQPQDTYGDHGSKEWQNILSNCATTLILGANNNDKNSKKEFSDWTGTMSVEMLDVARGRHRLTGISDDLTERIRFTEKGVNVLKPEEIAAIQPDEILIITANTNCTLEKKFFYKRHPAYEIQMADEDGNLVRMHQRMHVPEWKKREEEAKDENYTGMSETQDASVYKPILVKNLYIEDQEQNNFKSRLSSVLFEEVKPKVKKAKKPKENLLGKNLKKQRKKHTTSDTLIPLEDKEFLMEEEDDNASEEYLKSQQEKATNEAENLFKKFSFGELTKPKEETPDKAPSEEQPVWKDQWQ